MGSIGQNSCENRFVLLNLSGVIMDWLVISDLCWFCSNCILHCRWRAVRGRMWKSSKSLYVDNVSSSYAWLIAACCRSCRCCCWDNSILLIALTHFKSVLSTKNVVCLMHFCLSFWSVGYRGLRGCLGFLSGCWWIIFISKCSAVASKFALLL